MLNPLKRTIKLTILPNLAQIFSRLGNIAVFVHCIKIKQSLFQSFCFKISWLRQWSKETTSILLAVSEWKWFKVNKMHISQQV